MIVRVSVVLKGTVGDCDSRFDNLNGSHLHQSDFVSSVDGICYIYKITLTLKMTTAQDVETSLSPTVLF